MKFDEIESFWTTDINQLLGDKEGWDDLSEKKNHASFFSSDWFKATLQWQDKNTTPLFWVAKQSKIIKALMPLCIKQKKIKGISHRVVEWLKVPDSQFCDMIAASHDITIYLTKFYSDLFRSAPHWDKIELYPVTDTLKMHAQACQLPLKLKTKAASLHYWIDLNSSWVDYYATRSRRLKKSNNHLANRLESQGNIEIKQIVDTQNYTFADIISTITNISKSSWKLSTDTTFNQHGPHQFISMLTKNALNRNEFSLWLLLLNGTCIAYEYQLSRQNNVYALRSDFDEKYRDLSPGSYLNWKILENIFSTPAQAYWMGPGTNTYKTRWENNQLNLSKLVGYASTIKGRLLYGINESIIPYLKARQKQN